MSTEDVLYVRWIDLTVGSIGLIIGLYSLAVNILILYILIMLRKKSVSDVVFCHLAITDILASFDAIFAFGLLLSDRTYFDFYFIDDIICQFTGITWCVVSIATPLLLSVISLGRFLALYLPHKYDAIFKPPLSSLLIALSWIISIIGGTMHIWKAENMRMEKKWGYCDYRLVDIYTTQEVRYIVVFLYSVPLSISTLILLICNVAVAMRLIKLQIQAPNPSAVAMLNSPDTTNEMSLDFDMSEMQGTQSEMVRMSTLISSDTNRIYPEKIELRKRKRKLFGNGRNKAKRKRKEKQVIIATLLFSLNFGVCYFVMLYYYFSYMIYPTYNVFKALSNSDPIRDTYIVGWFYYATFLSSSINPIIHFMCNGKIQKGYQRFVRQVRSRLYRIR